MDTVAKYAFSAPVPGESLTQDPNKKYRWEKPPEFTNVSKAMTYIFNSVSNKNNLAEILDLIRDGVALDELALTITTAGFQEGKWTPDLQLLLIEPVIYMLYFLATQAGIDPIIYREQDEDLDPEEESMELEKRTAKPKLLGLAQKRTR